MKDKYAITIKNIEWNERGNYNSWRFFIIKNGEQQFTGFELVPYDNLDSALEKAKEFIK